MRGKEKNLCFHANVRKGEQNSSEMLAAESSSRLNPPGADNHLLESRSVTDVMLSHAAEVGHAAGAEGNRSRSSSVLRLCCMWSLTSGWLFDMNSGALVWRDFSTTETETLLIYSQLSGPNKQSSCQLSVTETTFCTFQTAPEKEVK